jgi:hypothetical protein
MLTTLSSSPSPSPSPFETGAAEIVGLSASDALVDVEEEDVDVGLNVDVVVVVPDDATVVVGVMPAVTSGAAPEAKTPGLIGTTGTGLLELSVTAEAGGEAKAGGSGVPAPYGAAPEAAAGAAAAAAAATVTPVWSASAAGMEDRPTQKFSNVVVTTGQLPSPPPPGIIVNMTPQGMQSVVAASTGQVVTYAVAVTTLESQGATAVTVI